MRPSSEAALRVAPRLSVCLSVCPVPGVYSKTENNATFKLRGKVTYIRSNRESNFEVKSSKIKVTEGESRFSRMFCSPIDSPKTKPSHAARFFRYNAAAKMRINRVTPFESVTQSSHARACSNGKSARHHTIDCWTVNGIVGFNRHCYIIGHFGHDKASVTSPRVPWSGAVTST